MIRHLTLATLAFSTLFIVSACEKNKDGKAGTSTAAGAKSDAKPSITITGDTIPATTGDTAAIFMKVTATGGDDKLIGASAEGVTVTEIHETHTENGISSMHAIKEVALTAKKEVAFQSGGLHVMLIGLPAGGLKAGGKVKVTFKFEKAGEVHREVPVVAPAS